MRKFFLNLIACVRRISGDDAYERYLEHHQHFHSDQSPLTREMFFKQEQERKWNHINRCC